MIPVTYPSSLSYRTTRQMVAYPITDLTGKRRWTDYIPVKFVDQTTFTVENSHNNNAYISVDMLSSNANLKEGIDYIPVYIDNAATDAWQVSATGYIPVGYSGAALSLQFAGSTFLDSRITFTRASSGTYFDNTGVLRRANRNLLTYSEQFDNAAWTKLRASIAANTIVSPGGTLDADKLIEDTSNDTHFVYQFYAATSTTLTLTAYAKAAERTRFKLEISNFLNDSARATFNLLTGAITDIGSGGIDYTNVSATATAVGNGWYRCSLTATKGTVNSTNQSVLGLDNGLAFSYAGNGTSGIFIWGAQLEEGSTATVYAKTVASTSGAPRFDHDPVTKAPRGLLIEEQRTNLLTYSEEFDNAAWTKVQSSITANTIVSPDGTLNGDKLVENTATADHAFRGDGTISAGATISFSIYAKAAERTNIRLQFADTASTNQTLAFFNLSDGTTSGLSQTGASTLGATSITAVGNGWYRCVLTGRIDGSATTARCRVSLADASNNITYTGNGTSGIFIWGAQLEAGSFATSYTPTVAAQVTRSADSASMTGTNFSSWYRADEGTLYAEFAFNEAAAVDSYVVQLDDTTDSNRISFWKWNSNLRLFATTQFNGTNVAQASNGAPITAGNLYKVANGVKTNDWAVSFNGAAVSTDTSLNVPTVSTLRIGSLASGLSRFNGTIRKLAFYPARLSNTALQSLTA